MQNESVSNPEPVGVEENNKEQQPIRAVDLNGQLKVVRTGEGKYEFKMLQDGELQDVWVALPKNKQEVPRNVKNSSATAFRITFN